MNQSGGMIGRQDRRRTVIPASVRAQFTFEVNPDELRGDKPLEGQLESER